jgi:hypothetical protein
VSQGWIGVDLDGTLAHYDGWKGENHVGAPVMLMAKRVRQWLREGREVRIVTARVFPLINLATDISDDISGSREYRAAAFIQRWCKQHFDQILPLTCAKDFSMIELWDDRAVQVQPNTGRPIRDLVE